MQKSKKLLLSLTLSVVLLLGLVSAIPFVVQPQTALAESYFNADYLNAYSGDYYNGLDTDLSGRAFRADLARLITSTHNTSVNGYDALKTQFLKTDLDVTTGTGMVWYYTGTKVSGYNGSSNREHVWPKDSGKAFPEKTGPGCDLQHLRPTDSQLNSTRGSLNFDELPTTVSEAKENGSGSGCYYSKPFFYPTAGYRGATARILMYVQVRWGDAYNLQFVDAAGSCKTIGKISTLMKWHLEEPPTQAEIYRNNAAAAIQGNRNPFIDHPEYAALIYCCDGQSYNQALVNVVKNCGDPYNNVNADGTIGHGDSDFDNPTTPSDSISLDQSSISIRPQQTKQLTATASGDVVWKSSNTSVATVSSSGLVTGQAEGKATITAVCGTTLASCVVNVSNAAGQVTGSGSVVITADSFPDMSGSYEFKQWDTGVIRGLAYIYGSTRNKLQFNSSKPFCYLASSTPTPAAIKSVTVVSEADKDWELLTCDSPYGQESTVKVPTKGNSHGTQTVTPSGTTWDLTDNTDTYFSLNYKGSGVAYLMSITVVYDLTAPVDPLQPNDSVEITSSAPSLNVGGSVKLAATASGDPVWMSSDVSVATVSQDGTVVAVSAGTATITATCGTASDNVTVTVVSAGGQGGGSGGGGSGNTDEGGGNGSGGGGTGNQPATPGNATEAEKMAYFSDRVFAIVNAESRSEKFQAIKVALVAYQALSEQSKAQVASDYAQLQAYMQAYNASVQPQNDSYKQVLTNSLLAVCSITLAVQAMIAVIKQRLG